MRQQIEKILKHPGVAGKVGFGLAVTALTAGLAAASFASAQDSIVISGTGYGSNNSATITNNATTSVSNTNSVGVTNTSSQTATSGSASSSFNTTGGSATTGTVSNTSSASTSITITNSF